MLLSVYVPGGSRLTALELADLLGPDDEDQGDEQDDEPVAAIKRLRPRAQPPVTACAVAGAFWRGGRVPRRYRCLGLHELDLKLVRLRIPLGPRKAAAYRLAVVQVGNRQVHNRRPLAAVEGIHYTCQEERPLEHRAHWFRTHIVQPERNRTLIPFPPAHGGNRGITQGHEVRPLRGRGVPHGPPDRLHRGAACHVHAYPLASARRRQGRERANVRDVHPITLRAAWGQGRRGSVVVIVLAPQDSQHLQAPLAAFLVLGQDSGQASRQPDHGIGAEPQDDEDKGRRAASGKNRLNKVRQGQRRSPGMNRKPASEGALPSARRGRPSRPATGRPRRVSAAGRP